MNHRKTTLFSLIFLFSFILIYPKRVVSLAPGITEIIFSLGQGDSLVGKTKFCNFPPETKKIKNIGGYLDMNLEMIIDLKPDVIFHYPEHLPLVKNLKKFSKLVQVNHKSIADLLNSISTIGNELDSQEKSISLIKKISFELSDIEQKTQNKKKKSVLFVIGRDPSQLKNITVIGNNNFINEIILISGGENAFKGIISYPSVSIESIIKMDPDIIIEFAFNNSNNDDNNIKNIWQKFPGIRAVRSGNLYIVREEFWVRPGPRIIEMAVNLYHLIKD